MRATGWYAGSSTGSRYRMSETSTISVPAGVPAEVFTRLLARGRQRGSLTPDDVIWALEKVELTPELIDEVRIRPQVAGIPFDESGDAVTDDDLTDERLAAPPPAPPKATPAPPDRPAPAPREERATSVGTADPVRMYLKEIGKVPLLTGPQEVELAQRIEAGLVAAARAAELEDRYGDASLVPPEQLLPFEAVADDGLQAKRDLIEANLRLV